MADDKHQPIIIKKKKGGHAAAHGGAWKLAFADFMTAMMAFFLVMWIVGLDVKTRSGLAEYFSNPGAFQQNMRSSPYVLQMDGKPPMPPPDLVRQTVRELHNIDIEAAMAFAARLKMVMDNEPRCAAVRPFVDLVLSEDGLRIELLEGAGGIFFAKGTMSSFREAGKLMIQVIAPTLAGSRKRLTIEGHTDKKSIPLAVRWDVSGSRALAVRRVLEDGGCAANQFSTVKAMADIRLRRGDAPDGLDNLRVSIVIPFDAE